MVNGSLVMHHGPVTVPHQMSAIITEVLDWTSTNKDGANDLIILDVWDCQGPGCDQAASEELAAAGIVLRDCSAVGSLTVGQALALGELKTGGAVLAHNCHQSPPGWTTYDDTRECAGFKNTTEGLRWRAKLQECVGSVPLDTPMRTLAPSLLTSSLLQRLAACAATAIGVLDVTAHYNCHKFSLTKDYPFNRLRDFDSNLTALPPPPTGLYSIQGSWAESIESVVRHLVSPCRNSSLYLPSCIVVIACVM